MADRWTHETLLTETGPSAFMWRIEQIAQFGLCNRFTLPKDLQFLFHHLSQHLFVLLVPFDQLSQFYGFLHVIVQIEDDLQLDFEIHCAAITERTKAERNLSEERLSQNNKCVQESLLLQAIFICLLIWSGRSAILSCRYKFAWHHSEAILNRRVLFEF